MHFPGPGKNNGKILLKKNEIVLRYSIMFHFRWIRTNFKNLKKLLVKTKTTTLAVQHKLRVHVIIPPYNIQFFSRNSSLTSSAMQTRQYLTKLDH